MKLKGLLILLVVLSVIVAGVAVALSRSAPDVTDTTPGGTTAQSTTTSATTAATMRPDATTGNGNSGLGGGIELPDDSL